MTAPVSRSAAVDPHDDGWLARVTASLDEAGYVVIAGVLDDVLLARVREAMYGVRDQIRRDIGTERLQRAGELGVLRIMSLYDPVFLRLLEVPELLAIVDATVSPTAVLHLQNGLLLSPVNEPAASFQHTFHRDFPRYLNGYRASVNVMIAVDAYTRQNGGTLVVPGTHQRAERPSDADLAEAAVAVECDAGSLIVFDSTLWHAAGQNVSGGDRLGINHQFTRSFVKQQVDYVRALGDDVVHEQPPRTQQLLGWYTRVVTSLDEYYQPPERRLYRAGQG